MTDQTDWKAGERAGLSLISDLSLLTECLVLSLLAFLYLSTANTVANMSTGEEFSSILGENCVYHSAQVVSSMIFVSTI